MNSTERITAEAETDSTRNIIPAWRWPAGRLIVCLLIAAMGVTLLSSCAPAVPASRRLPGYVKRIYVPEFRNEAREFGLQAELTLNVVDAFLSDGRLDVVQNERADVRLEGKIIRFEEGTTVRGGDRFPLITIMRMECTVDLWDPYDADRIAPLYRYRIPATVQYVSDERRSTLFEARTDARSRLMAVMAQNIVSAVLTGTPVPLEPVEQRGIDRYRERRGPQNYEPVDIEPRYPDPTTVDEIRL